MFCRNEKMDNLPKKIIYDIANYLEEEDIINLCKINERFNSIGNDEYFNRFKNVDSRELSKFDLIQKIVHGCGDLYFYTEEIAKNINKIRQFVNGYTYVGDKDNNLYLVGRNYDWYTSELPIYQFLCPDLPSNLTTARQFKLKVASNIKDIGSTSICGYILKSNNSLYQIYTKQIQKNNEEMVFFKHKKCLRLIAENVKKIESTSSLLSYLTLSGTLHIRNAVMGTYKNNVKLFTTNCYNDKIYYVDRLNKIYKITSILNGDPTINIEGIYQSNIDIINIKPCIDGNIYIHTYDGYIYYCDIYNKIHLIGNFIKLMGYRKIMAINNNLELVILSKTLDKVTYQSSLVLDFFIYLMDVIL